MIYEDFKFLTFCVICMLVSTTGRTADITVCIACHNDKMVANPILDGQHAKYIEKQLHDLKKDLRSTCSNARHC